MQKKPELVLLTHEFPFGNSETSFIEPELPFLLQHFNLTKVVTFRSKSDLTSLLPSSIEVVEVAENQSIGFISKLKAICHYYFWRWLFNEGFKVLKSAGLNGFKLVLSQFFKYFGLARVLKDKIDSQDVLLYSYWFDHWTVAGSIYKRNYNKKAKVISRAHRYEIDKNTNPFPTFPFLRIQSESMSLVSFISAKWKGQFVNGRPIEKISRVSRMGVEKQNSQILEPIKPYKVVSISANIPVKQMIKQAQVLAKIGLNIEWHHFGGDKNINPFENIIRGTSVTYKNHGFVQFKDLIDWLKNNPLHFLLSTSKIEGIPVSMMECLSLGIPIIALDVGGISEIVNSTTGVLCPNNIEVDEFAGVVKNALLDYQFTGKSRLELRRFQEENFLAAKNYTDFCTTILEIVKKK